MYGLVNMSLFLLLTNFIGALIAVQLFRGDIPANETMNFSQLFNAFLAMYQVSFFLLFILLLTLLNYSYRSFHQKTGQTYSILHHQMR
jgi:hypothetical protein